MAQDLATLQRAVHAGMAARKHTTESGNAVTNPHPAGTDERAAFDAGYINDLAAWMVLFDAHSTRPLRTYTGRLRPHDSIIVSNAAPKYGPGEFLSYLSHGYARVRLDNGGFARVKLEWITRKEAAHA